MKKIITYCTLSTLSLLIGCAAPPLQYYTLTEGTTAPPPQTFNNMVNNIPVIYISRITVPDYLNTTDITTRSGTMLNHSANGSMSSILSVGATGLITNLLTSKNPNIWITDIAPVTPSSYQLMINIKRFDLQTSSKKTGGLTVEATWSIIPRDTQIPVQNNKTSFVIQGSIKTDNDVVILQQKALIQLTDNINNTIQQLH